jgi:putative FmdB family regulatory protein
MPLYEYECKECGLRFQRRQHFTEDPLEACPECKGEVHRLVHPVAIIFKGKGFYVTDNRKASSATSVPKAKKGPETSKVGETSGENDDVAESGRQLPNLDNASSEILVAK